jgi:hypothetical protein
VIFSKYGTGRGDWCTKVIKGHYGVGLWKNIRKGWANFASHTRLEVGDESQVLHWIGNGSFSESTLIYSNLLAIKMPWFQIIWSGSMVRSIGSRFSSEQLKIRK